jgi:hypothetical protein
MWAECFLVCQRREEAFRAQNQFQEEEEEVLAAPDSQFSIHAIVEKEGPASVRLTSNFSWQKFQLPYEIGRPFLLQVGRGCR